MRLAVLSEADADEAALRILVPAIRGQAVDWVPPPPLRSRGWPSVRDQLEMVIRFTYFRTDAVGLVVVADTNGAPLHQAAHTGAPNPDCRYCTLRGRADQTLRGLPPVAGRPPLRVAVGLSTPAIEAWYLCNRAPHPSEATWTAGGPRPYDKNSLKRILYGTDRGSPKVATAVAEAARLATDITVLRTAFPVGFGTLATEVLAF